MQNQPPFFRIIGLPVCRIVSTPIAACHHFFVRAGWLKIPLCIRAAPGGIHKNLRLIWFSRVLRRVLSLLVRTPLRQKLLRLVDVEFPDLAEGSVIAMCHTPWARLLTQWCLQNNFALIITGNEWDQKTRVIRNEGRGFTQLRQLIRHLQAGGKIIVMVDVFNNLKNCAARFLEKDCNISLLPARLAKIAGVPLISAIPEWCGETIHIHKGPWFNSDKTGMHSSEVMQTFLSFFENEIRRNPSIWSAFVRGSLSSYTSNTSTTVC